jgi:hypothetical protein
VGINDLARATALASVGLAPSTATSCAQEPAASAPGAQGAAADPAMHIEEA